MASDNPGHAQVATVLEDAGGGVRVAVEQTSTLRSLPNDICLLVCDQLPLYAKILLSQTRKAMRHVLHNRCALQPKALSSGHAQVTTVLEDAGGGVGLAVEQTPTLRSLPNEILLMVCDQLPLYAKILLSQTCKAMWYVLHNRCALQLKALSWVERSGSLTELGNLLPNYYHCTVCNNLHHVEFHDAPDLSKPYCCSSPYQTRHRYLYERLSDIDIVLRLQSPYAISFAHVQLALKYSRMKETYQDCLKNILSKFETCPSGSPIIKKFTAQPKVVNTRFILSAKYVLNARPLRDAAQIQWWGLFMFCPHHYFETNTGLGDCFAGMLQKAVITAATTQKLYSELFSCDGCPTDYSLVAENDKVVVEAWHDLGSGLSVDDPKWQSHRYSGRRNWRLEYRQFNYEHGSISKVYNSAHT